MISLSVARTVMLNFISPCPVCSVLLLGNFPVLSLSVKLPVNFIPFHDFKYRWNFQQKKCVAISPTCPSMSYCLTDFDETQFRRSTLKLAQPFDFEVHRCFQFFQETKTFWLNSVLALSSRFYFWATQVCHCLLLTNMHALLPSVFICRWSLCNSDLCVSFKNYHSTELMAVCESILLFIIVESLYVRLNYIHIMKDHGKKKWE